jgi:hypothetical protein
VTALLVLGTVSAALVLLGNTPPPRPTPPAVDDYPRWVQIQGNHGDGRRWLTPGEIIDIESPLGVFELVYGGDPRLDYSVDVEQLPSRTPGSWPRLIVTGRAVGLGISGVLQGR